VRNDREKDPGPRTPDPSPADRKSVPPAEASRMKSSSSERRLRSGEQPTGGRENGGTAPDRREGARAECPEARECRSRRKRGLAPDPEARPFKADRREAENDRRGGRGAGRCDLLGCAEPAVSEVAHRGRPERATSLCRYHLRRGRECGAVRNLPFASAVSSAPVSTELRGSTSNGGGRR
jgi:hypothetical protein